MQKPNLLVFASGGKEGGGSGFENLVEKTKDGTLEAKIVAIVSNIKDGGVREKADRLKIPFIYFPAPWDEKRYRQIVNDAHADFVALSGWLKLTYGLDPKTTINIHPGPLPQFGGPGFYGHYVHKAVMKAFRLGKITHSAVTMHFVTEKYDEGPVFFRALIKIKDDDTPESLGKRVNQCEHKWQPVITNLVVQGKIKWDGKNLTSLIYPADYSIDRFEE